MHYKSIFCNFYDQRLHTEHGCIIEALTVDLTILGLPTALLKNANVVLAEKRVALILVSNIII